MEEDRGKSRINIMNKAPLWKGKTMKLTISRSFSSQTSFLSLMTIWASWWSQGRRTSRPCLQYQLKRWQPRNWLRTARRQAASSRTLCPTSMPTCLFSLMRSTRGVLEALRSPTSTKQTSLPNKISKRDLPTTTVQWTSWWETQKNLFSTCIALVTINQLSTSRCTPCLSRAKVSPVAGLSTRQVQSSQERYLLWASSRPSRSLTLKTKSLNHQTVSNSCCRITSTCRRRKVRWNTSVQSKLPDHRKSNRCCLRKMKLLS